MRILPGSKIQQSVQKKFRWLCCAGLVLITVAASAQENRNNESNVDKKVITLSAAQLKSFEGYFQRDGMKEMYVQFIAGEKGLKAKLLWNDGEMNLYPDTDSSFFSKEGEAIGMAFRKNAAGEVTSMAIRNTDTWTKVNDYKPLVRKEISLAPGELNKFEGIYKMDNNEESFIQFMVKENKLVLKQHWDGEEITFVPESALDFFNPTQRLFSLHFTRNAEGKITEALAYKRDLWKRIPVVQLTSGQLNIFAGKYRFKDDPDDLMQISVQGNALVARQLWDGKETTAQAVTATYFYNPVLSYPLAFTKDASGNIQQVTVLGHDVFEKIKE